MSGRKMAKAAFMSLLVLMATTAEARKPQPQYPAIKDLPAAPKSCSKELRHQIVWGAAASAYQIEGAWNEDGKLPSIWDTFAQKGGETIDNANGNVANDFYHRWHEDIALMKKLGVKSYRMSIAWTRIIPTGAVGSPVNPKGVAFYKTLITELLKEGIVPAITMFHWDLPQALQDSIGGFHADGTAFHDAFVYYADTLFREFGPLIKLWMTFNEPLSICDLGYGSGVFAPGVKGGPAGQYKCGHNLLVAHAKAVKLYKEKYLDQQGGKISIALDGKYGYPLTDSVADKQAAQYWHEFNFGWMADPLYFGDYPESMRRFMGDKLPAFTAEESALLKGSTDYYACNFYNAYYIKANTTVQEFPFDVTYKNNQGQWVGEPSASFWLFRTPEALRKTLSWLDQRYSVNGRKVEFTISENGVSGPSEATMRPPAVLQDNYRMRYYSSYIDNLCKAITEDGIKFSTFWAWSLWDNFEWRQAYTERFGMVYVDLKNGLERIPKASAYWMARHFWAESALFEPSYYKGLFAGLKKAGKHTKPIKPVKPTKPRKHRAAKPHPA